MSNRRRSSSRSSSAQRPASRRAASHNQRNTVATLIVFAIVLIIYIFFPDDPQNGQVVTPTPANGGATTSQRVDAGRNMALGNPSGATTDTANPHNYLIVRDQNALSYNRDDGIPNWVSWHLMADDMGNVGRSEFQPDTSLPAGWYQVRPSDYTNSGYDRGHMTPSADRNATVEDNQAVFLMTNIVPQAPDNNQGPWAQLEEYSRSLVRAGNELYIISGVYGTQGQLERADVRIPTSLWKVIVVLPEGDNDLERITAQTDVIAVDMRNQQGIRNNNWQDFLVSVDQIEQATGYDLLSSVDPAVQAEIESGVAVP